MKKIAISVILVILMIINIGCTNQNDNPPTSQNQTVDPGTLPTSSNSQTTETEAKNSPDTTGDFLMPVEDVFSVTGKGTAITGRIERGTISVNDTVQLLGMNEDVITTVVTDIESFRQSVTTASADDLVSLYFDIPKEHAVRGQVAAKPDSISLNTSFSAEIKQLTIEEGGSDKPISVNFEGAFYFRGIEIPGTVTAIENDASELFIISVTIAAPIAMEVGTQVLIRQDDSVIAEGNVTEILG